MASRGDTSFLKKIVFSDTVGDLGGLGTNYLESQGGSLYYNGGQLNTGSNILNTFK